MAQRQRICGEKSDPAKILRTMYEQLRTQDGAWDVILEASDGFRRAHKCVMASVCPTFHFKVLEAPNTWTLSLATLSVNAVDALLRFWYLGEANIALRDTLQLLSFSQRYEALSLSEGLKRWLKAKDFEYDEFVEIAMYAHHNDNLELLRDMAYEIAICLDEPDGDELEVRSFPFNLMDMVFDNLNFWEPPEPYDLDVLQIVLRWIFGFQEESVRIVRATRADPWLEAMNESAKQADSEEVEVDMEDVEDDLNFISKFSKHALPLLETIKSLQARETKVKEVITQLLSVHQRMSYQMLARNLLDKQVVKNIEAGVIDGAIRSLEVNQVLEKDQCTINKLECTFTLK